MNEVTTPWIADLRSDKWIEVIGRKEFQKYWNKNISEVALMLIGFLWNENGQVVWHEIQKIASSHQTRPENF